MSDETDNDILEHYGVMGMHWGQHKARITQVVAKLRKPKTTGPDNPDHFNGKPTVNTLSNTELKARINRLNLEKQYKQLTTKEVSKGEKYIKDQLAAGMKDPIKNFISQYAGKALALLVHSDEDVNHADAD
jgi:hypothetical protein